ncbi:hypothetical protein [Nocardia sp. NPDC059228]|uniref:hypothetical protein n=1 Tax=Nocardia sp. NPDC059228 TaxID=3346777 RepID=UPI0036CA6AA6
MVSAFPRRPIRVFQVATGNVGTEMIKRIGAHPDLELIGCLATTLDSRDSEPPLKCESLLIRGAPSGSEDSADSTR